MKFNEELNNLKLMAKSEKSDLLFMVEYERLLDLIKIEPDPEARETMLLQLRSILLDQMSWTVGRLHAAVVDQGGHKILQMSR